MSDNWVLVYGPEEIPEGHTMHPYHVEAMRKAQADNPPTNNVTPEMLLEVALIPYSYWTYILTGKKPNG